MADIEIFVKVKGHFDFDVTDPKNVKQVYVMRSTVLKTVLSEEGIQATMEERGIPRNRAIEDLFVEGQRNNVRAEDIVSISTEDETAQTRIADLYGVKTASLSDDSMSDPKLVTPLKRGELDA